MLPSRPEEIAQWREELSSLCFFHKQLKQNIARAINLPADVPGHWRGTRQVDGF